MVRVMPEGPEIKQSADQIAAALEGKPLKAVQLVWPALTSWEKELAQHRIVKVEARSKAMLLHWSNQMTLYSHNQLYGVWYVRKNGFTPKTNRALRLSITGPQKTAWLYSATDIALLDPDELAQHPYLLKLGPDVLHPQTDLKQVLAQYQDPRFRRRRLSTLLLDQGFLAGLGNYLRSEILFVAGVPIHYRGNHPGHGTGQDFKSKRRSTQPVSLLRVCQSGQTLRGVSNAYFKNRGRKPPDLLLSPVSGRRGVKE